MKTIGTIRCKHCGKRLGAINNAHLRVKRGYIGPNPVEEYKLEYGLEYATSDRTRKRIGKDKQGNTYWLGKKHSKASKKKMSAYHKTFTHTEKTKKALSKINRENKRALGYKHTRKFKKWISQHNREWWQNLKSQKEKE